MLMSWCFSTRASAAILLTNTPLITLWCKQPGHQQPHWPTLHAYGTELNYTHYFIGHRGAFNSLRKNTMKKGPYPSGDCDWYNSCLQYPQEVSGSAGGHQEGENDDVEGGVDRTVKAGSVVGMHKESNQDRLDHQEHGFTPCTGNKTKHDEKNLCETTEVAYLKHILEWNGIDFV